LKHVFNPLVRREQAEREDDVLPLDFKAILVETRVSERHVGDAVRDDFDLVVRHAVHVPKELSAPLGHHNDLGGKIAD
jgi:hypothetical protein